MIIKKITLKNFYRYGPNEQTLDLTGTGINGIVGPNGYGKSTCIVDSLCFAFYGKYRCDSIDEVVNRYTGKDCKVGVEFEQDGKSYKILRYRKHTTHNNNIYIFENDNDISGHTASETNNKIIDIIKMPYIAFINSSVFSSELYSAFLANKVSERLVVFENILSLKEINLFYTKIKEILKDLYSKKEELETKKVANESEKKAIDNSVETYSNNARTKLLEMKSRKDAAKNNIIELNEKIKELNTIDIVEEKAKLSNNSLKEEYLKNLSKVKNLKNNLSVEHNSEDLIIIDKYKNINFEENRLKELKYKEDLETIKARENGYNISFERLNSLRTEYASLVSKNKENERKLISLDEKIAKLAEATCPFCGQHLTSEKAEDEKKKAEKEFSELKEELDENKKKIESLDTQIKEENENYNYLLGDANRLKEKLNKDFIPNSDLVFEQYNNALKKYNEIEELKKKNSIRYNELIKEEEELNNKIKNIKTTNYTESELNSIFDKINSYKQSISENEKEIASIDGQVSTVYDKKYVEELKAQSEEKNKEIIKIEEKIKLSDDDILHYEYLADCFSNKSGGFKKYFIGEMIDVFNTKINQYLPFFFEEDVKIKFDKNLDDTITMDGFEIGFSSFSQGQRQRAELAINFALFDVARIFFSNDNKLLILDEMDKGLDKFGIKAMVNLLKGFDKQLKIFIVSHNPLMDEEIDTKIKISRDANGFSVLN
jgi:DNA repair exonuclease SbcCD ATPase subunit